MIATGKKARKKYGGSRATIHRAQHSKKRPGKRFAVDKKAGMA